MSKIIPLFGRPSSFLKLNASIDSCFCLGRSSFQKSLWNDLLQAKPYHLGASHSKSLEFLLVPLTQDGRTNFEALTLFLFQKTFYLPFFSSLPLCPFFHNAVGDSVRLHFIRNTMDLFLYTFKPFIYVTDNTRNIFVFVVEDFRLIGEFLRQLLVSLATKKHWEICFPIQFYGKLEVLKKKQKTNEFSKMENGYLHVFFHSILG